MIRFDTVKYVVLGASIWTLFHACSPKGDVQPKNSGDALSLIDSTKGFHKVFRYFESSTEGGTNINPLDITLQNATRLNIAFYRQGTSAFTVKRASIDVTTKSILRAPETLNGKTGAVTFGTGNCDCGYSPQTDVLSVWCVNTVSNGVYFTLDGDITENTGVQPNMGSVARFGKLKHLVMNPRFFSDGITRGDVYGYFTGSKFQSYRDIAGYTGDTHFNEGIFEANDTSLGLLIAFSTGTVSVYERNLADVNDNKASMAASTSFKYLTPIAIPFRKTLLRNTGNTITFALSGVDGGNSERFFWTFTYNLSTKTLTKVVDNSFFTDTIQSFDIDDDGNVYILQRDGGIVKMTANSPNRGSKLFDPFTTNGKAKFIRLVGNTIYLGIVNVSNGLQLDIIKQD